MSQPDLSQLFAQAQQLQQEMLKAQDGAKSKLVEASAGGGMVTATMTGGFELRALKIDPQCVDLKDLQLLQDLIIAAINQAIQKAQEMVAAEMGKVTGGLGLPPGLF